MEVPNLSSSSIWSLDDHVSVVDKIEILVVWELRNNEEISLNVKSELLVELTLGWLLLVLVNVDDSPFLMGLTVSWFNDDISILIIEST
jgi:hypothetical protein